MLSFSRLMRLVLVFLLLMFISANVQGLELDIKNAFVNVGNDSVVITLTYEVDALQKLQLFLFGAMPVRDELATLTNSTAEFLKVGVDEAVFKVYFETSSGTKYFPGLEFGSEVDVYINVSGTTFIFENSTKIPPFYYS